MYQVLILSLLLPLGVLEKDTPFLFYVLNKCFTNFLLTGVVCSLWKIGLGPKGMFAGAVLGSVFG